MAMTNMPRALDQRMGANPANWVATHRNASAVRMVSSSSELTPDDWQHLLALVAEHRLEEAHQQIDRYLRVFPGNPQLWIQRGNLFWKQHKMEEAELAYRHAAQLAPESAAACWCLVLLYQHMERTEEAARWYQRAMAAGLPQNSMTWLAGEFAL